MKFLTSQYLCTRFIYKKKLICRITKNGEVKKTYPHSVNKKF